MRIDFGFVLAIILEYIFFVYYADTSFYKKRNNVFCKAIITAGYALHFFICIFGNVAVNIISFFLINAFLFILCYHISNKNAVFQSVILTVISIAGEFAIASISKLGISVSNPVAMSPVQSFILTISSKLFYLIGIIILTNIFKKNNKNKDIYSICLVVIPVLTLLILLLMTKVTIANHLRLSICVIIIIIDFIAFILNQTIAVQRLETEALKQQAKKEEIDFEKYEKLSILHHDIKEHLNTISALIDDDNEEAKKYIKSLYLDEATAKIIDYTDNKMLNIVLSKKKEECLRQDINYILNPVQASLTFFRDTDIVALFSNLINNAIDSCKNSKEKKIYIDIYTVNDNFVVIRIENSSDKKPLVIDGKLRTHKDNDKFHGIGMLSIRRILKKYDGTLLWKYDEDKKLFCTTITINKLMLNG